MKTSYYTAASLDGFIATADDSLEWRLLSARSVEHGNSRSLLTPRLDANAV